MAPRIDGGSLRAAWRALEGGAGTGWRTIPIQNHGAVRLLAGRHLPDNEEAVLVSFPHEDLPPADQLPQGRGFGVANVVIPSSPAETEWIGLSRNPQANLDLFAAMAIDVVEALFAAADRRGGQLSRLFLLRIRAWQDFMQRGNDGVLGPEAELGLVGELRLLQMLLDAGMPPATATGSWRGPMAGLHDYSIGAGAIEVKSSIAPEGFLARISSLEQLDDALVRPLFVAALRFELGASGEALPERVAALQQRLSEHLQAAGILETRLLHAGYYAHFANRYVRRFADKDVRLFEIGPGFPRLTPASVQPPIRHVRYELDLDRVTQPPVTIDAALRTLGAI
jgi:hypothetical protein